MYKNELPATRAPYKLDAGEGLRYAFGNHPATLIARPEQLGQSASGCVLTGAKGARFPLHRHMATHEALFVLDGVIALVLDGSFYQLTPGDYVNIPKGTAHGYEFADHRGEADSLIPASQSRHLFDARWQRPATTHGSCCFRSSDTGSSTTARWMR